MPYRECKTSNKFSLKQLATILLLSATLLQPLQNFWIRFSFELNRTYIAKNLCVNRTKPELKCGGKCYLMKKLAEKQKQEQKNERTEVFVTTLFLQKSSNFLFSNNFSLLKNAFNPSLLFFTSQECILGIFRPPCV